MMTSRAVSHRCYHLSDAHSQRLPVKCAKATSLISFGPHTGGHATVVGAHQD